MTETPPNGSSVPALAKGMEILEFLSKRSHPAALQEISNGLHRSRGELYRMVTWLTEQRYVVRSDSEDKYVLGERLGELFRRQTATQHVIGAALPLMSAISARVEASCHLSIRVESNSIILLTTDSSEFYDLRVKVGIVVPLWERPAGACMLAETPDDEKGRIRELIGPDWRGRFDDECSMAEESGYVVRHGLAGPSVFEFAFASRSEGMFSAITVAKLASSDAEVEWLTSLLQEMSKKQMA